MTEAEKNYFEELNSIDVSGKTEKKNNLTYLSWPWAWGELKKRHPDATYQIYENDQGWNYFSDGRTCWVKTGVTVNGIEHIEELPVMDFKNKSIPFERVTSYDVNKTIQRSLTKAIARHGLGLYIYAGEDLPEEAKEQQVEQKKQQAEKVRKARQEAASAPDVIGEAAVDLWKELVANGVDSSVANDCLHQAAAQLGAENPRMVHRDDMAEFMQLVKYKVSKAGVQHAV